MRMPNGEQEASRRPAKALVTGATSGLGRAIAERLACDDIEVIVHGRSALRGDETVKRIVEVGGRARFVAADLAETTDVMRLGEAAADVDVLVNNAGFSWFGPTADLSAEAFDALFASNVRAPYFLVAALGPAMAAKGGGSIVSISSMAARVGLSGGAVYGATKAALEAMTRSWAAEYSPSGVRVNAVAAGPVYTDGALPERTSALGATTLLQRAARAEEIAEVVAFLVSPQASYLTGAIVAADGGRTAI
jgi:NAD(P)-dependent dehydrogenase (short-subunit alcohol dehydrogenase family)